MINFSLTKKRKDVFQWVLESYSPACEKMKIPKTNAYNFKQIVEDGLEICRNWEVNVNIVCEADLRNEYIDEVVARHCFMLLEELISRFKILQKDNQTFDIEVLEEIVSYLRFEENPAGIARQSRLDILLRNDKKFIAQILLHLQVCILRLKFSLKAESWFKAVDKGILEEVKNLWETAFTTVSQDGLSPLLYIVRKGNVELIKWFLTISSVKNDISNNDFGYNVIHYAITHNDPIVVKTILANASQDLLPQIINTRSKVQERTPLHLAALKNNPRIVKILCQHGATFNIPDSNNLTPAMLCDVVAVKEFFKKIDQTYNYARQRNEQELFSLIESDEDCLPLVNVRDHVTGKSPMEIFFKAMELDL